MPRAKAAAAALEPEKPKTGRKIIAKKIIVKKKAKPVIVDVIEDDDWTNNASEEISKEEPLIREVIEEEKDLKIKPEDIDQQKKFFTELQKKEKALKEKALDDEDDFEKAWIEEEAPKNKNNKKNESPKNISLYRRLVWKFLILVGILAAVVFYFFSSKLTITITPNDETLNDILFLKISGGQNQPEAVANDPREAVNGTIKEIVAAVEKSYPASGEEAGAEEISGQVTIVNNYSKDQALVATTRILSPDNKLYRIKEAVNAPAGGEVVADIYVEKPSADLAIRPTTFSIPGLWLGLQDKIFARSNQPFVFKSQVKKYVKQSDIEAAKKDMSSLLMTNAAEQMSQEAVGTWLYDNSATTKISVDAKADDVKDSFKVSASGTIIGISLDREQAGKMAAAKLNLLVPDNKELVDFKPENITYSLENYDPKTGEATVKATFNGLMAFKTGSEIIDRKQLINLSKDQLANYLKNFPDIKKYELEFSPKFVTKVPNLVDRITIKYSR